MLRKTIFAAAAALAVLVTVSAVSTDASASPRPGGFGNHHFGRVIGGHPHRAGRAGLVMVSPMFNRARCHDAECGGGVVPVSAEFVIRGCVGIPIQLLPPWCQDIPGAPRATVHGLRR